MLMTSQPGCFEHEHEHEKVISPASDFSPGRQLLWPLSLESTGTHCSCLMKKDPEPWLCSKEDGERKKKAYPLNRQKVTRQKWTNHRGF
jgi:hypothetical protein